MSYSPTYGFDYGTWGGNTPQSGAQYGGGYATQGIQPNGSYVGPSVPNPFNSSQGNDLLAQLFGDQSRQFGFSQALNLGQLSAAPQFAQNENTRGDLATQIALAGINQSQETNYLNSTNANDLAKLGLQGQNIDIAKGANQRQVGYLNTLHDLAGQLFNLNTTEAWQGAAGSQRQVVSQDTAKGSIGTPGQHQAFSDIKDQLTNQLSEIGIHRGEEQASYEEKLAANTDAGKQLDLQAQQLGIDRNQLQLELQRGLDRLGLSTQLNVADLYSKLTSSNINDATIAQQILQQAIQNSDYFSQFYQGPGPSSYERGGYGSNYR